MAKKLWVFFFQLQNKAVWKDRKGRKIVSFCVHKERIKLLLRLDRRNELNRSKYYHTCLKSGLIVCGQQQNNWKKNPQGNSPLPRLMLSGVIHRVLLLQWVIPALCSWLKASSFVQSTIWRHEDSHHRSTLMWYYILANNPGQIWDGLCKTALGMLIVCCFHLLVNSPIGIYFLCFLFVILICDIIGGKAVKSLIIGKSPVPKICSNPISHFLNFKHMFFASNNRKMRHDLVKNIFSRSSQKS